MLCSDQKSFLAKMFSANDQFKPMVQEDGKIFLDRNGEVFQHVIDYLRDGKKELPEFRNMRERKQFFKELEFWHIETRHFVDAPAERFQHMKTYKKNAPFEEQEDEYTNASSQNYLNQL